MQIISVFITNRVLSGCAGNSQETLTGFEPFELSTVKRMHCTDVNQVATDILRYYDINYGFKATGGPISYLIQYDHLSFKSNEINRQNRAPIMIPRHFLSCPCLRTTRHSCYVLIQMCLLQDTSNSAHARI